MNTSCKCNCCAKESVCKYSVEYKRDCEQLPQSVLGRTTELRFVCTEFMPIAPAVREVLKND